MPIESFLIVVMAGDLNQGEGIVGNPLPLLGPDTPEGIENLRRRAEGLLVEHRNRPVAFGDRGPLPVTGFRIVRFTRAEVLEEIAPLPGGEG